ncbi:MAG: glycosyltransferase family 9 protein [Endomicrobia bacterium]|nr:glycosyltransferase family 9 protein [Endomicrobiia bacterium]
MQNIKFDCRFFRGNIPCKPNKQSGAQCGSCKEFTPVEKRILIIKLGAIGDVIRTTPLAVYFRNKYPNCNITWVTHFPEILPKDGIDEIMHFDFVSVYAILHRKFEIAVNLDKEVEACALLSDVSADEKYGYIWDTKHDHIAAATPAAEHKLLTGFFDRLSKDNTKHYAEEIFEICHLKFNDEPYLINYDKELAKKFDFVKQKEAGGKKIIGLNTGCSPRWKTRLWPREYWEELAVSLIKNDCFPILLGGEAEHEMNSEIQKNTGVFYPGYFSLQEFIALISLCSAVVTQVTMALHIATALRKPVALMNNIFNANEFYLYKRGVIVEPSTKCDCYYGSVCKRERPCVLDITPKEMLEAVMKII